MSEMESAQSSQGLCDLSPYKAQPSSSDTAKPGIILSEIVKVSGEDIALFEMEMARLDISWSLVAQLIWHRVLSVFGTSITTSLLLKEDHSIQKLRHSDIENLPIFEAVQQILTHDEKKEYDKEEGFDAIFSCNSRGCEDLCSSNSSIHLSFIEESRQFGIASNGNSLSEIYIRRFLEVAVHLLEQTISGYKLPVSKADFLPVSHRERMDSWNHTDGDYPREKRLDHLFEDQAANSGNKIAVKECGRAMTYNELNVQANQLAKHLRERQKVSRGQFVGLHLKKSTDTIVCVLALWKCGAASVAIDPAYPDERVKFSITDMDLALVITHEVFLERMGRVCKGRETTRVITFEEAVDLAKSQEGSNLDLKLSSSELAYVSYTSGTTGTPKGIPKKHTSLVNSITDLAVKYEVQGSSMENIVLYSSYVFEPFYRQMLMALVHGHRLLIVDDDFKMNTREFSRFLADEKVTYLNGTPSILQEYDYSDCVFLKRLILVGEQLTKVRYDSLRQKFKGRIICEYGFTESAFVTLMKQFDVGDNRTDTTLGKPVRNVKCYVLDAHQRRVPMGVIGTLYVGGSGVSLGYLNRIDLTKKRFLPNPFNTEEEKKRKFNGTLYNTGDLVSWSQDGQLRFHGRSDFQIKLRGIRIEPGEIETVLSSHAAVKKCVVVVRSNPGVEDEAGRMLIAFYINSSIIGAQEDELKTFLEGLLPRYMVPARIVEVNRIPVNINGKVDMKALPEVSNPRYLKTTAVKSCNVEDVLRKAWSKVLGIPEHLISADDDFFVLGGNSIRCVQVISLIEGFSCSFEDFFTFKTISKIAKKIVGLQRACHDSRYTLGSHDSNDCDSKNSNRGWFLATSMQQSMVYQNLREGSSQGTYTMQSVYEFNRHLQADAFKTSWLLAMQKFRVLTGTFVLKGHAYLVMNEDLCLNFSDLDFSGSPDYKQQMDNLILSDLKIGWDLSAGPLFRVYLISVQGGRSLLFFSCHHIILDDWSLSLLFDFVVETYNCLVHGQNPVFLIDKSYERALVELEEKEKRDFREDEDFWSEELEKVIERADLTGLLIQERKKTHLATYDRIEDQQQKEIILKCSSELKGFCQRNGVTLHSALQFIWHQVLSAYGNGKQTVVGTTFSGRNIPTPGIEKTVGLLINTLPVIVDHSSAGQETVGSAISDLQDVINRVSARSHCWVGKLPTGSSKHELFDSLFVFEVNPATVKGTDCLSYQKVFNYDKLDFPLAAVITLDSDENIGFRLMFAGEVFDSDCISHMLELVEFIATQIAQDPLLRVANIDLVVPSQKAKLDQFNDTEKFFPLNLCLHEIFELEAERVKDKTAVIFQERSLSYRELNNMANELAHNLRTVHGICGGDIVNLFQEKSELLIVSILAIWKCGAAFVPIGVDYPAERVKYIMDDSAVKLIITCSNAKGSLDALKIAKTSILNVEEFSFKKNSESPNQQLQYSPGSLAYIIYTSGTTGNPKGVMVEHKGVANLKFAMEELFDLKSADEVILSFSNYIFDHFVEQMNDAILTGQTLVLLDDELRYDKDRLYDYMARNRVTYLSGTPTVVSQYCISGLTHLRRVDVVGEDLNEETFRKLRNQFTGLIINGYGPTEISITSHKKLYQAGENRTNKSIGSQVSNSKTYVVNSRNQLLPIGAIGEMMIGGVGVTRGYLNNPTLSSEKFVPNKFKKKGEQMNNRLYSTGDLVRWLPNGEIEYLGRVDQQVKIRGIRIEIAEIESVLSSHKAVNQVAVKLEETGNSQRKLVAFVSPINSKTVHEDALKKFASYKLPSWLLPTRIIVMEQLPVSPSGKLNYKMLPNLSDVEQNFCSNKLTPSNEVEELLSSIWSKVLNIPDASLSMDLNFFLSGGDSLLVIHLISAIREEFAVNMNVTDIMASPTIEQQASAILGERSDISDFIAVENMTVLASDEQEGLLFIEQREGGTDAYNIHMVYCLDPGINVHALEMALSKLLQENTILRTVFNLGMEGFEQQVVDMKELEPILMERNLSKELIDNAIMAESKHIFRLESEIPFRAVLFIADGSCFLSVIVHHVAFDGHSVTLFERELQRLYLNPKENFAEHAARLQFRDFCYGRSKNKEIIANPEHRKHTTIQPDCEMMFPGGFEGEKLSFNLGVSLSKKCSSVAKSLKVTMNCALMAVFASALQSLTEENDISFHSPIGTRNSEFRDTIGFFVSMQVLTIHFDGVDTFSDACSRVKKETLTAMKHAHGNMQVIKGDHPSLVFATRPSSPDIVPGGLFQSRYSIHSDEHTPAKFDLFFEVIIDHELTVEVTYRKSLYTSKTINQLVGVFVKILREQCLPISGSQEPSIEINSPNVNLSLGQIFKGAVHEHSDSIALVHGRDKTTYSDLLTRASKLAVLLRHSFSVKTGDRVVLHLDKDINMIVAILGVWLVGAAYIPLDIGHPISRLEFIVSETQPRLILCNSTNMEDLKTIACCPVEALDKAYSQDQPSHQPEINLNENDFINNLAYIIYTSGTTGKPKGVQVGQKSVISFLESLKTAYFTENELQIKNVLFMSNYAFDFSIEQILLSLFCGGTLVLPEDQGPVIFDEELYNYANKNKVDFISGTPSHLMLCDMSRLEYLQVLVIAGEAVYKQHIHTLGSHFRGTIIQAYGTTETTVYNTFKVLSSGEKFSDSIGSPLQNSKAVILDESMKEVAEGEIGELYLFGPCLSLGYINRPQETSSRFIKHNLGPETSFTVYKTGDLARKLKSGELQCLGRNDSQLSVNGVRVEKGEIEYHVQKFGNISQNHVLPHPETNNLVCFFIVDDGKEVDLAELFSFLEKKMPPNFIPKHFIPIPELPLTSNGKIDRIAMFEYFPQLQNASPETKSPDKLTDVEREVNAIWCRVLGNEETGLDDDFFLSGGDSIMSLRLVAELRSMRIASLRILISVKDIFKYRTIRKISQVIQLQISNPIQSVEINKKTDFNQKIPLLPIQNWFFSKDLDDMNNWNQCFTIETPMLDHTKLRNSVKLVVEKHDVFRYQYKKSKNGFTQHRKVQGPLGKHQVLHVVDATSVQRKDILKVLVNLQKKIDIVSGPMHTIAYIFDATKHTSWIWFAVHHLVVDTVSWGIIRDDLMAAYKTGHLKESQSISYSEWSDHLQRRTWSDAVRDYWSILRDGVVKWTSETDHVFTSTKRLQVDSFALTSKETGVLVRASYGSVYSILLASLGKSLQTSTGQAKNYVTLEGHGREGEELDLSTTVGWFTSMFPVELSACEDLEESAKIIEVKKSKIPQNGLSYGFLYGYNDGCLPKITFNFLGKMSRGVEEWRIVQEFGMTDFPLQASRNGQTLVDITAAIFEGRLVVEIQSKIESSVTNQLLESFEANIRGFCAEKAKAASNLGLDDMNNRTTVQEDEHHRITPHKRKFTNNGTDVINRDRVALSIDGSNGVIGSNGSHGFRINNKSIMDVNECLGSNGHSSDEDPKYEIEITLEVERLFILPPGEGGAESYLDNIVPHLQPHYNLHLFNNLYRDQGKPDTFPQLAAAYVRRILAVVGSGSQTSTGKVHLLGWSFGGVLSLEIALQLQQKGVPVGNIFLIDPFFDVAFAYSESGIPSDAAIVDDINMRYKPDKLLLNHKLADSAVNVILFKATKAVSGMASKLDVNFFQFYLKARYNNLDRLLPTKVITVHEIFDTHYTWVRNQVEVGRICNAIKIYINADKHGLRLR